MVCKAGQPFLDAEKKPSSLVGKRGGAHGANITRGEGMVQKGKRESLLTRRQNNLRSFKFARRAEGGSAAPSSYIFCLHVFCIQSALLSRFPNDQLGFEFADLVRPVARFDAAQQ